MNFETFVVSLKDEYERRSNIENQLDELSADFCFVDAVDLRTASADIVTQQLDNSMSGSLGRKLTRGEVGCALSHFLCYEKLLSSNLDWAWVIEDDADLRRLKKNSIEKILSSIADRNVDVIILGYSKLSINDEMLFYKFEPIKHVVDADDFYLGEPWKNWTCGTVSYLISKSGAKKMLDYFSNGQVVTVADDWLFFNAQVGINMLHIRPLMVFEDFERFNSALEQDRAEVSKKRVDFWDFARVIRGFFRMILMKF